MLVPNGKKYVKSSRPEAKPAPIIVPTKNIASLIDFLLLTHNVCICNYMHIPFTKISKYAKKQHEKHLHFTRKYAII